MTAIDFIDKYSKMTNDERLEWVTTNPARVQLTLQWMQAVESSMILDMAYALSKNGSEK